MRLVGSLKEAPGKFATVNKMRTFKRDVAMRKTKVLNPTVDMTFELHNQLSSILPEMENRFATKLGAVEALQFLQYRAGDFYAPHFDSPQENTMPAAIRTRAVSVVIFVNSPEGYEGGELILYSALGAKEQSQACGFLVQAQNGLLVAFRSNLLHEVKPVIRGIRYVIASWFHSLPT